MSELTFQDHLLLTYTLATVVQVVVVAASLLFIYRQTHLTTQSVKRLEKREQLNAFLNHQQRIFEIDRLVLQDDELSTLLNYNKKEMFAFMLIEYSQSIFWQKRYGELDPQLWRSFYELVRKIFNMGFVQSFWQKVKLEYTADFSNFVDEVSKSTAPSLRELSDFDPSQ